MQIEKVNKTDVQVLVNATGANVVFKDIKVVVCAEKVKQAQGQIYLLNDVSKVVGSFSYSANSAAGGNYINVSVQVDALSSVSEDIISFINAIEADTNIVNL